MARKFISLFSGAMGLDLGIEQAGFEPAVCVEIDAAAIKTIKKNRPGLPVIEKSVADITGEEIKAIANIDSIDLLAGGPPCQAFSVFGNRLGIEDARGQLVFEYLRLVDELRPKTFIMENVRGLMSMSIVPNTKKTVDNSNINPEFFKKGSLLKKVIADFNEIGYHVDCFVVNSANYGAPQIRERVILIGNKHNYKANFPKPLYSNRLEDDLPPFKTLGDAIGPKSPFIDQFPEVMNFSPRKLKYLSMVPEGGNWRSLPEEVQKESMGKSWYLKGGRSAYWRKLSFAFPSPTVVTMPNHAGTSMCHPTELRAISVGEAAAIQEFPKNWDFQGSTTQKFKQVGNAVPTRLGRVAAETAKLVLEKIEIKAPPEFSSPGHTEEHIRPHIRTRTFFKNGQAFNGDTSYYQISDKSEKSDNNKQTQFELFG